MSPTRVPHTNTPRSWSCGCPYARLHAVSANHNSKIGGMRTGSARPVRVCTMVDRRHGDDQVIFVDLVKDAVGAASGRPGALERRQNQSFADATGILQECGGDELVDCGGDFLR